MGSQGHCFNPFSKLNMKCTFMQELLSNYSESVLWPAHVIIELVHWMFLVKYKCKFTQKKVTA